MYGFGLPLQYAKIDAYSWRFIGSWKSALVVLAIIGLVILLLNVKEIFTIENWNTMFEFGIWAFAVTVTSASLLATTTEAEFIWAGTLIGLGWLMQISRHAWHTTPTHKHHYIPAS